MQSERDKPGVRGERITHRRDRSGPLISMEEGDITTRQMRRTTEHPMFHVLALTCLDRLNDANEIRMGRELREKHRLANQARCNERVVRMERGMLDLSSPRQLRGRKDQG